MKSIKITTAIFVMVLLVSACKKEHQEPLASFKPDGFWRGNAAHHHMGILNRPDGTSRFYYRIYGLDTAGATIGNGRYSLNGNSFKAEYIMSGGQTMYLESGSLADKQITGQVFHSGTPDIIDFTIRKQ